MKQYKIIKTRKISKTLKIIGKNEHMCQCMNVQNLVYANKNRCMPMSDGHQLSNPDHKNYRILHSTLMKKSNQVYYNKYFKANWNNIKSR